MERDERLSLLPRLDVRRFSFRDQGEQLAMSTRSASARVSPDRAERVVLHFASLCSGELSSASRKARGARSRRSVRAGEANLLKCILLLLAPSRREHLHSSKQSRPAGLSSESVQKERDARASSSTSRVLGGAGAVSCSCGSPELLHCCCSQPVRAAEKLQRRSRAVCAVGLIRLRHGASGWPRATSSCSSTASPRASSARYSSA